jgi:hypothetical protein
MTTWNIYKSDGLYLGQSKARNAETAFCDYMALVIGQPAIGPNEIKANEIEPGVCEITYNKEVFTVRVIT